jgi:heme O synthase-like polyprenyltransferase
VSLQSLHKLELTHIFGLAYVAIVGVSALFGVSNWFTSIIATVLAVGFIVTRIQMYRRNQQSLDEDASL